MRYTTTTSSCHHNKVFNCPWEKFNTDEAPHMIRASNNNKKCMHLTDARRLERDLNNDDLDLNQKPDRIFNLTMNFRYGASINNVKFQYPKTPLYEDPRRVFKIMHSILCVH